MGAKLNSALRASQWWPWPGEFRCGSTGSGCSRMGGSDSDGRTRPRGRRHGRRRTRRGLRIHGGPASELTFFFFFFLICCGTYVWEGT